MSERLQQVLSVIARSNREHDEKRNHERQRAQRALDHLLNEGCFAWHDGKACEWQARCDEPGCTKATTCGTQTPNGYRRTCAQHRPDKYVERKRT